MVLFSDAVAQRHLLSPGSHHVGSSPHPEFVSDPGVSARQCPSDDGLLPGWAAAPVHRLCTIPFLAVASVGRHGGTSRGVRRRPNAGKRWTMVFDGGSPPSLPVDA